MRHVYMDHQAATPVLPEVFEAMKPFFTESFGSPSSLHRHGLRARDALATARTQVAALIHAESPDDIIFTSSGTESANLAVKGTAYAKEGFGQRGCAYIRFKTCWRYSGKALDDRLALPTDTVRT